MSWEGRPEIESLAAVARCTGRPDGEVPTPDLLGEFGGHYPFGLAVEAFGEGTHEQGLFLAHALLAKQACGAPQPLLLECRALGVRHQHRRKGARRRERPAKP